MDQIEENKDWFIKLLNKAEDNDSSYKSYSKDYKKAEEYTTLEEFQLYEDIHMLYEQSKLPKPITSIGIHCHPTYTSPSGRNHYYKDAVYSHDQIKTLINLVEARSKQRAKEQQEKEEKNRAKREKEKRLRELDKLEKHLKEKEESLNAKEKEFLDATKDQMYSTDSVVTPVTTEDYDSKELSISQKLKILKTQFENGEITYSEYQEKRKELM